MKKWDEIVEEYAMIQQAIKGVVYTGEEGEPEVPREGGALDANTLREAYLGAGAEPTSDPVSITVCDSVPDALAVWVSYDHVAAAAAALVITQRLHDERNEHGRPHDMSELRKRVTAGWSDFITLLCRACEDNDPAGKGWDLTMVSPRMLAAAARELEVAELREIAELAGRMEAVLWGLRSDYNPNVPEELGGVTTGDDPFGLLPAELAHYHLGGAARADLIERLGAHRAAVYERFGEEPQGRGPVVICIDQSGSMRGQPRVYATSAATALTRMAWNDGRPVKWVAFATATRDYELPKGAEGELLRAQSEFLGGGTAIGKALRSSQREVEKWAHKGVGKADIVLITDGYDGDARSINKSLDAMGEVGTRLFTISIGGDTDEKAPIRARASTYAAIDHDQMENPDTIANMAGALAQTGGTALQPGGAPADAE